MAVSLARHSSAGGFMNAASPGVIALFQPDEHYATLDDYLEALSAAMRPEYEVIMEWGWFCSSPASISDWVAT